MSLALVNITIEMLRDAVWYLERICDTAYVQPLPKLSGATIGQHTRHIVSHYQSLSQAMRAAGSEQDVTLNYNSHCNYIAIENSPRVALAAIDDIIMTLPRLSGKRTFWVENNSISEDEMVLIPTNGDRELLFNIEHTLHHFELIRMGLNIVAPCLELPVHFGVKPQAKKAVDATMPLLRTIHAVQLSEQRMVV